MSDRVVGAVTMLVAIGGFGLTIQQLRQNRQQQKVQLGALYIGRFWTIDDDSLRHEHDPQQHKRARYRYLRLCEDEFEAARRGWLAVSQWDAWHGWHAAAGGEARSARISRLIVATGSPSLNVALPDDPATTGAPVLRGAGPTSKAPTLL